MPRAARYNPSLEKAETLAGVLVEARRPLTRSDLSEALGLPVDKATLCRWIHLALEEKMISRNGLARAAIYEPTPEFRAQFNSRRLAAPVTRRPRVGYEREFLLDYVPNKSSYLGETRLAALHRKCPIGSSPTNEMDERGLTSFMADLAYSSSKLEGNTYSYKAMLKLVDEGVEASGHDPEEAAMLLNHYEAAGFLARNIAYPPRDGDPSITRFEICSLHTMLSFNLLPDPRRCGQIRVDRVEIGESAYIPLSGGADLAFCFEKALAKAAAINDPYEQAMFLLVHLPYLQAFDDCNKRTARVACSIPLLRAGVVPMSWHDTKGEEFIEGILSVYEYNDTYKLAEVFSEGYARSAERFALAYRPVKPSMIAMLYRKQVRKAISDVVAGDDLCVPDSVKPTDAGEFLLHVTTHLDALRENSELAAAYGLSKPEIQAWCDSDSVSTQRDRQR